MNKISSWGRLTFAPHHVVPLHYHSTLQDVTASHLPGLAHGFGRSYGDVCLNAHGTLWQTSRLDRFLNFNPTTGRLVCESGVSLKAIQDLFISRGWMLPVTPGTQWVTVGGAIANDVHGKNHHRQGTFGHHIHRIKLLRTSGQIIECGPDLEADWFAATVGGMGLTGVMTQIELQLMPTPSPWLESEIIPYDSLETFFELASSSEANWAYTVSWIDCTKKGRSRGLFMRANPLDIQQQRVQTKTKTFPVTPPFSLVNRFSLKLLNEVYFRMQSMKKGKHIVHYIPFFYPLDHILMWNRLYGRKGFYQYQCVIPKKNQHEVTQLLLDTIQSDGEGSFLSVLKTFGARPSLGMMSFPQEGVTLALDFANRGQRTLALFKRLDALVDAAGGRLYCAKNAFMSPGLFRHGYPRLEEFLQYRDPGIQSDLSKRLMEK
jgi:hypothetical protein